MLEPTVAICIPTFNQSTFVARAISSAFAQDYGPVEVWVSDDASTDQTWEEVTRASLKFPELRQIRQPFNLRIAGNNNSLLSKPQTDFIVRLDSDDMLEPNYVRSLVSLMAAHPDAGYGHAAIQTIDGHDRPIEVVRVLRPTGFRNSEDALREALGAYRVAANILIFRTEALRAVGYYRDLDYGEDYDLAIRMADAGYGNVYCDSVLARYRVWNDSGGVRSKRKASQLVGYIRIFDESFGPAFERRGWDTEPLRRRRRTLALRHAPSCFAPHFDAKERAALRLLLIDLAGGENAQLKVRLIALQLGLRRVFEFQRWFDGAIRKALKNAISRVRRVAIINRVAKRAKIQRRSRS